MSVFSLITFVLIAVSSCAVSSQKSVNIENQPPKKVDLSNHIGLESYTPKNQVSHAMEDEARQKRAAVKALREFSGEYKDLNDIIEDLEDNSIAQAAVAAASLPQEIDLENMPPLTYFLLLQKLKQLQSNEPTYRVRTPRLGRSIDFQLFDAGAGSGAGSGGGVATSNAGNSVGNVDGGDTRTFGGMAKRQLTSRVIKKSVPFKPRLGKRTQACYD